jgi:hypothetical protein
VDRTRRASFGKLRNLKKLFLLVLLLTLFSGCTSVFFYPSRDMRKNPFISQFDHQDIYFETRDGLTLNGWFFKAQEPVGSILVLHGNAENISTHVNGFLWLVASGFNVFIFDYRGYGRSEGEPSLRGIQLDAEAALGKLLTLPSVDKNRIAVFGQSLGGTAAVNLAAAASGKGLIKVVVIDSAFASHRIIAREKIENLCIWPFPDLLSPFFSSSFSPVKRIADVAPAPVLILHGLHDAIVPVNHSSLLFAAARQPKELWLTTGEGHIRSIADPAVRERLKVWLLERFGAPERVHDKK